QTRAKLLAGCERLKVAGHLPPGTSCASEAKTAAKIVRATTAMRSKIGQACGGDDRTCGGNLDHEDLPPAIAWPAVCPNFESGACANAIAGCGDVAECLLCIDGAAVDQAVALYFGAFVPTDPVSDLRRNQCQQAIGSSAQRFLSAKAKILQKCWD